MTKHSLTALAFSIFLVKVCLADSPAFSDSSPFLAVTVKGDMVVATLPKVSGLMVAVGVDEGVARPCKESEVFSLTSGSSLRLFARHFSYVITSQLHPKPGLNIEFTFDGRSLRRGITTKKYFVAAIGEKKDTEQGASRNGP